MPQPTREQFQAAAQKVMQSAPPGLSREQFFQLVDKEMASQDFANSGGSVGLMKKAAQTSGTPEGEPAEPDTYWGGFLGSVKKDLAGLPDALSHSAHPQSIGDFLSLLIPSGVAEAGPALARTMKAGANEAKSASGLVGTARKFMKGMKDYAFTSDPAAKFTGPEGFSRYATSEAPAAGDFGGALMDEAAPQAADHYAGRSALYTPGQASVNESPLWQQQQMMEETGAAETPLSGGRSAPPRASNLGSETAPPSIPPRVVGKAPVVNDALESALTEMMGPADEAQTVSGIPDQTITDSAPLRQSGKFGKRGSLGQAGGFTSGRPGTTESFDAPPTGVVSTGTREPHEMLSGDVSDPMLEELSGGTGTTGKADKLSDISSGSDSLGELMDALHPGESAPRINEAGHGTMASAADKFSAVNPDTGLLDTANWSRQDWEDLRALKGARDAARLTGKTADEVRQLSGGGPSRIPTEARERIDNYDPDRFLK